MPKNNTRTFLQSISVFLCFLFMITNGSTATPLWTFEPLTTTILAIPTNSTAVVQYRVTNQSNKTHTLLLQTKRGIQQIIIGPNGCSKPFTLVSKSSCTLSLMVDGNQLISPITGGPVVCQQGNLNQCYQPGAKDTLHITLLPPSIDATITVIGSPLTLTTNGLPGQLTIKNLSMQVVATNVTANFTGTALDGQVTETGNTCAFIPAMSSCNLTFTPGNTVVPQTNFIIQGTNTNALLAAIAIQADSTLTAINPTSGASAGGTSFTLTGTGLTGVNSVTFDGIAATGVTVVDSMTVTGVTPAHNPGPVSVMVNTSNGSATLANQFNYDPTNVGQPASGGTIACLNGGLNDLIAATTNISENVEWGGFGISIPAAQSGTDGASNTAAIVSTLNDNGGVPYAAQLCSNFQIDSQGNSPCQTGNICYDDWFLPASSATTQGPAPVIPTSQLDCLYANRNAIGNFTDGNYWSSTEYIINPTLQAWIQFFGQNNSVLSAANKNFSIYRVRCVRTFTP